MKGQQIDTSRGIPVYLNVYNFWSGFNRGCGCVGLGVYHTGIEISQLYIQYMYYGFDGDESGVIEIQPKSAAYEFSQQILLGYMTYTYYDLETQVMEPLRLSFLGNRYDLFSNNCNHFAYRMAEMLGLAEKFPTSKIFKITNFFNTFRCCIPECITSGRLDWFITKEDEELEEVLHERYSQGSFKRISNANNSNFQDLIEEDDDLYVKERQSQKQSQPKTYELTERI